MSEFVKNIAMAGCCLLVVCCTNAPNQSLSDNYYIEENDSIPSIALRDLEDVSILNYSDLYDSVSLVKLEAHPEALIGRVSKVEILGNGNFLVFDNTNAGIFVFSQDGRFLNTVGCQGNGAKEYITPEDVVYDAYNNEVIVWDHNKKNLMFFHPDGRFVRKVNIPWYIGTLQVLDKDHIAVFMNHRDEIEGEYGHNIKILDREGIPVSEGLPYDKRLETFNPACKKAFSTSCGVLFCNPPYSSIVYEIGQDSIMPRYFLDFGDRAIPKNWFGNMDHRELNKQLRRNPDLAYCASFHETANSFLLNVIQHGIISICLFPSQVPMRPNRLLFCGMTCMVWYPEVV